MIPPTKLLQATARWRFGSRFSTCGAPCLSSIVRRRKNFEVTMVQTHGLTHINLAVRDLGRALRFYEQVFGLQEYGRGDGLVHTQASGRHEASPLSRTTPPPVSVGASHISAFGS